MSLLGSIFPGDKELGKKDDDHRPGKNGPILPGSWTARKQVSGLRKRRIIYAVLGVFALFLFVWNIPTDLGSNNLKGDLRVPRRGGSLATPTQQDAPSGKPPRTTLSPGDDEHYYTGPVNFYKLATTLHSVATLAGRFGRNKNVLFAAASLKSASEIIPLACEMALLKRNDVHFAFMGREDLEIHEIKEINGINDDDCNVHWHGKGTQGRRIIVEADFEILDARPDYSRWSSDFRMEVSITAGIGHIHKFVIPQAIIIDNADREDSFFVNSVKSKATEIGISLIQLPSTAAENMMWITRLDSGSLAAWQTTYVDILIHAPPKSSGSLIRLLRSIQEADYFGYRRPHITIELPADIDVPTYNFLENMIWPPIDWSGAPHASQITLRHRILKRSFTAAEASSYLVDSFYPARPLDSHVLVLSPQVELSPVYYHYLIYTLLELRYSKSSDIDYLMGISLELPFNYLNGSAPFDPPGRPKDPVPFLWEAPNCNAALYFGERWMEFHSFLSNRLSTMKSSTPSFRKQIAESYPAWMEYLLELMRARGYSMLYPHYESTTSNAFATIHSELYQEPEEYAKKSTKVEHGESPPPLDPADPLEIDSSAEAKTKPHSPEYPLLKSPLVSLLPPLGELPSLSALPHLSYHGLSLSAASRLKEAEDYAMTFRQKIGSCAFKNSKIVNEPTFVERTADDLFCNLDDPLEELQGQMNANPPMTAAQQNEAFEANIDDPDAIPANRRKESKDEFAAHLRRQSGKKESKTEEVSSSAFGDDSTSVPYQWDPKVEEDKRDIIPDKERDEAQAEFAQHLVRQGEDVKKKPDKAQKLVATKGRILGWDEKSDKTSSSKKTPDIPAVKQESSVTGDGKASIEPGTVPDANTEQRDRGW